MMKKCDHCETTAIIIRTVKGEADRYRGALEKIVVLISGDALAQDVHVIAQSALNPRRDDA